MAETELEAARAMAQRAGFGVATERVDSQSAPGVAVLLVAGSWSWRGFVADGAPEGEAERVMREGMAYGDKHAEGRT